MKYNLNLGLDPNNNELNWNLALIISIIILLFILFNYGITLNNRLIVVNTGDFLPKS